MVNQNVHVRSSEEFIALTIRVRSARCLRVVLEPIVMHYFHPILNLVSIVTHKNPIIEKIIIGKIGDSGAFSEKPHHTRPATAPEISEPHTI